MPDSRTILLSSELLSLISVSTDAQSITITARTSSCDARCPMCERKSTRVHSRYMRTAADLPWQNIPVTVRLHVRRFFCDEDSCERMIFAERRPELVEHYARRTRRLEGWFTHVSFALGRRRTDPDIQKCCRLFEEFARLFRDRGGSTDDSTDDAADATRREKARTALQQWMEEAKKSGVSELRSFAIKLSQVDTTLGNRPGPTTLSDPPSLSQQFTSAAVYVSTLEGV